MARSSLEDLELGIWSLKGLKHWLSSRKTRISIENPLKVILRLIGRAYSLSDTSGKPLPRPQNSNSQKIYYKQLAIVPSFYLVFILLGLHAPKQFIFIVWACTPIGSLFLQLGLAHPQVVHFWGLHAHRSFIFGACMPSQFLFTTFRAQVPLNTYFIMIQWFAFAPSFCYDKKFSISPCPVHTAKT